MLEVVLATMVLIWDPYPPPGAPAVDGVRCYYKPSIAWVPYESAATDGACHPEALIESAPFSGATPFIVRGYKGQEESPNSNEWRLCSCIVERRRPPTNMATDGICSIFVWAWPSDDCGTRPDCHCAVGECLDRGEFIACVKGVSP